MHRFTAPPEPPGFAAAVAAAVADVRKAIAQGLAPSFDESIWKKFTAELSAAQHHKCGFCEGSVAAVADPDVEHYYPKSQVAYISDKEEDWGKEVPPARVRGRKKKVVSPKSGYWWKAYAWDNYLLACGICNRKWKLTIFPVAEGENRKLPPDEHTVETPLLLNPFTGPHPAEHLAFDSLGGIAAHNDSRYGKETIKTCGLYRQRLRETRLRDARYVHEIIDEFQTTPPPDARRQKEILGQIVRLGDERGVHCGMIRAIAQQRLGLQWSELAKRLAANP